MPGFPVLHQSKHMPLYGSRVRGLETENKEKGDGMWQKETSEEETLRQKYQSKLLLLKSQSHQMKRGICVVYFDHLLRICLVFCIVLIPMTLLTALPLLSSALKENLFSGMESCPQSLVLYRPLLWWTEGTLVCRSGAVNSALPWRSATHSLIHLGWGLAENLRSDKAQLCPCDPAHWVLSFYRCVEKVGMEQAQAGMADLLDAGC